MKFGFTAMMSKQKPSLCNGSQKRHPHPIKHSKFGPLWKWCFNCEGVIHNELLPRGQTVNKEYYLKVMKKAEWQWGEKGQMWGGEKWLLHHDNAPTHSPLLIRDFLARHETTLVPQPPSSSELAPVDSFSSPCWNPSWKGDVLSLVEEIKENSLAELRSIPKQAFQECFQNWNKRWEWCITYGGEIFEGDRAHSSGVSEKTIYLKCSESIRTHFVHCPF